MRSVVGKLALSLRPLYNTMTIVSPPFLERFPLYCPRILSVSLLQICHRAFAHFQILHEDPGGYSDIFIYILRQVLIGHLTCLH